MLMIGLLGERFRTPRGGAPAGSGEMPGVVGEHHKAPVRNIGFSRREEFEGAILQMQKTKAALTREQIRAGTDIPSVLNFIFKGTDTLPPESAILSAGMGNMGGKKTHDKYQIRERALYAFSPEEAKRLLEEEVPVRLEKIIAENPHAMMNFFVVLLNPETLEIVSRRCVYSQEFKLNPDHYFVGRNGNDSKRELPPSEKELIAAAARAEAHFTEAFLPEFISAATEHLRSGRGIEVTLRMKGAKRDKASEQVDLPVDLRRW